MKIQETIQDDNLVVDVEIPLRRFLFEKKKYISTKDIVNILQEKGYKIEDLLEGPSRPISNTRSAGYLQEGRWIFSLSLEKKLDSSRKARKPRKPRAKTSQDNSTASSTEKENKSIRSRMSKLAANKK